MNKRLNLIPLILLQACAIKPYTQYDYLAKQGITKPTQDQFPHCYRYGCDKIAEVTFNKEDWKAIDILFESNSTTPKQERRKISQAIGLFEAIAGGKTGTKSDVYGTFRVTGPYQQDCIDESTNTTIYLSLLEQRGHLKHYSVKPPQSRVPILHAGRWPHRTAIIEENQSKNHYAVDSWFHDNGFPAEVVPLKLWKKGWKAEENFRAGSASHASQ